MLTIYNILLTIYGVLLRVAAMWNSKARAILQGRKHSISSLALWRASHKGPVIWVHCASHGEYEQVAPLLALIKQRQPAQLLVLTFYSPSGYTAVQGKTVADWVGYLPGDTKKATSEFLDLLRPKLAIWVKNEWWWQVLSQLSTRDVPIHSVAATFRPDQYFVRYPVRFMKQVLQSITSLGVVDDASCEVLADLLPNANCYRSGDIRADRVAALAMADMPQHPICEKLQKQSNIVIYGSAWLSDAPALALLRQQYPDYIHVIFPHDLTDDNIAAMQEKFQCVLLQEESALAAGVCYIAPVMGLLAYVYRCADYCYVGGGYGGGVHNVLEAAVYKKPVFVGPRYHKSKECAVLLDSGGLWDVKSLQSREGSWPSDMEAKALTAANDFFSSHIGAADRTYVHIFTP